MSTASRAQKVCHQPHTGWVQHLEMGATARTAHAGRHLPSAKCDDRCTEQTIESRKSLECAPSRRVLPKELPTMLSGSLTATRPNSFHKSQSNGDSSVRSVEEWSVSCRCISPKRVGAKRRIEKLPNRGEVRKTSPSLSQPKPRRKQRNFSATTAEHIEGNFLPKRIDNSLELLLLVASRHFSSGRPQGVSLGCEDCQQQRAESLLIVSKGPLNGVEFQTLP